MRSETNSSPAISRLERPSAASSAIRRSVSVSSSRSRARRPPNRPISAPRPLRPQRCAELLEHRQRRLERRTRRRPLLGPPLHGPERQQRARAIERLRHRLVPLERLAQSGQRRFRAAIGRLDQSAAAEPRRDRPRTPELAPPGLELGLHVPSGVQIAGEDERLGEVGSHGRRGRFALVHLHEQRRQRSEVADRLLGIAERQRQEPEDLRRDALERKVPERRRLPLAGLGVDARGLHPSEMRLDQRGVAVTRGLVVPQPGAGDQLEAPVRIGLGELPVPGTDLQHRQQHQRELLMVEIAACARALELADEQCASLREVAVHGQLEPEDLEGGVVARAPRRRALQCVGAQEQLALDTLARGVAAERERAQRLREEEGEPGGLRPRGSRLHQLARSLRLAPHLGEQGRRQLDVGAQLVVIAGPRARPRPWPARRRPRRDRRACGAPRRAAGRRPSARAPPRAAGARVGLPPR